MRTVTFTQLDEGVAINAPDGMTAQMIRAMSDVAGYTVEQYDNGVRPLWDSKDIYQIGDLKA